MSDITQALGLPDDYSISFKEATAIIKRFQEASGSKCPISPISFLYYADKFGDFTEKRNQILPCFLLKCKQKA